MRALKQKGFTGDDQVPYVKDFPISHQNVDKVLNGLQQCNVVFPVFCDVVSNSTADQHATVKMLWLQDYKATSIPTFQQAFLDHEEWLANNLRVGDDLLRALSDIQVINECDVETIQNAPNDAGKVRKLLDFLTRNNSGLFSHFCEILKAVGQERIVQKLWRGTYEDRTVYTTDDLILRTFEEAFRTTQYRLSTHFEVSFKFLRSLENRGIISERHVRTVMKADQDAKKVKLLLEILQHRDDALFPAFCEVLNDFGQQYVVKLLWSEADNQLYNVTRLQARGLRTVTMPQTFEEAFKGKRYWLAKKLEVSDSLLHELVKRSILNEEQVSLVNLTPCKSRRVDNLLDSLTFVDDKLLTQFIDSLVVDDQIHVAKMIIRQETAPKTKHIVNTSTRRTFKDAFTGKKLWLAVNWNIDHELLRVLCDEGIIKSYQAKYVRDATTPDSKVGRLIPILVKCDDELFPDFCDVLNSFSAGHIVERLQTNNSRGENLPKMQTAKSLKYVFQSNKEWLMDKLEVSFRFLLALSDWEIITDEDIELIQAAGNDRDKVSRLLGKLECGEDAQFMNFCEVLDVNEIGQHHIVERLRGFESKQWTPAWDCVTFKKVFGDTRDWLANKLEVSEILVNHLLERSIILPHHFENIQNAGSDRDKVDCLLNILERRDDALFSQFCEVLEKEEIGQRHVAERLRSGSAQSSAVNCQETFEYKFSRQEDWLANKLEVSNILINHLLGKRIIFLHHYEDIQNASSDRDKAVCLLDILKRRDDALLPEFCAILVDIGQGHVKAVITERSTDAEVGRTFKETFRGIEDWLVNNLEVTDNLLTRLLQKKTIMAHHVEYIQAAGSDGDKVIRLLRVLERRDDASFYDFCLCVNDDNQQHVAEKLCPERFERPNTRKRRVRSRTPSGTSISMLSELEEILEPDYGLCCKMRQAGVITPEHLTTFWEGRTVKQRVFNLLQAVVENEKALYDERFLKVLREDFQGHVANFVVVKGEVNKKVAYELPLGEQERQIMLKTINLLKVADERPLSEHERKRLLHNINLVKDLDLMDPDLQRLLLEKHVLNKKQMDDVTSAKTRVLSNSRLLRILTRRSVADVKQFFDILFETGQLGVLQLTSVGAVALISHLGGRSVDHSINAMDI